MAGDLGPCCEQYEASLAKLVHEQEPRVKLVQEFLSDQVALALETNWHGSRQWEPVPYKLRVFGSRAYGIALPNSDLDILCELPLDPRRYRITSKRVLLRVFDQIREETRCTYVQDAIEYKQTVEFCFAGLKLDFTVCQGDGMQWHDPTKLTALVGDALDAMPKAGRQLARLAVDAVKHSNCCWNRVGHIGSKLKAVHWVLLVIAWWTAYGQGLAEVPRTASLPVLLDACLGFYAELNYQLVAIFPLSADPFAAPPEGDAPVPPMWLIDPREDRNLAGRVDSVELQRIRAALRRTCRQLRSPAQTYWVEASRRWNYLSPDVAAVLFDHLVAIHGEWVDENSGCEISVSGLPCRMELQAEPGSLSIRPSVEEASAARLCLKDTAGLVWYLEEKNIGSRVLVWAPSGDGLEWRWRRE